LQLSVILVFVRFNPPPPPPPGPVIAYFVAVQLPRQALGQPSMALPAAAQHDELN
jgi:hypothetical protein